LESVWHLNLKEHRPQFSAFLPCTELQQIKRCLQIGLVAVKTIYSTVKAALSGH